MTAVVDPSAHEEGAMGHEIRARRISVLAAAMRRRGSVPLEAAEP
jgi:hypothetical protein